MKIRLLAQINRLNWKQLNSYTIIKILCNFVNYKTNFHTLITLIIYKTKEYMGEKMY